MTSNSAKTKTLTIGETIYISTKAEWDLLFNDTSGGEYYKQLSSDYDGKNITIFLSSTPTDADFFETNKIILLTTSNQSGKGVGRANLIGSGSADYQFLNCTIEGDISNCNLAFNADISTGMSVEGFPDIKFIPTPVLYGKVKDCQLYFCPTYSTTTTGKELRIGLNSFEDNNAILYKCNYGYNIQITIKKCMMLCRYISSSTDLTNISISTDNESLYSTTGESTGGSGNYIRSNVYCFYDINSINNLRFQDNIVEANSWKLGHIWNLNNSYIYSNVTFNNRLKYVSSTDFSSMNLSAALEESKIDFDSCICGTYPSWYSSHKQLQNNIDTINNNYYSKYFSSPFIFSIFRYKEVRMISIPNQDVSSLAQKSGSIDLGNKFKLADNKVYTFSGFLSNGTADTNSAYKIVITITNTSMKTVLNYEISTNSTSAGGKNLGLSIIIPCSIV